MTSRLFKDALLTGRRHDHPRLSAVRKKTRIRTPRPLALHELPVYIPLRNPTAVISYIGLCCCEQLEVSKQLF